MQFHAKAVAAGFLAPGEPDDDGEPTTVTRLVDDACIFLNRPGFAGGAGCALHIAALEAGERPLDWKPNVCWQVPLRLEHSTDENGHVTSRLREWKRRDWGEGGDEFHWWCTESPEAFVGDRAGLPVGAATRSSSSSAAPIYDLLVEQLERPGLGAAAPPGAAPTALTGRTPSRSVVVVVVVVELDAVLLGQRGVVVLVVLRGGRRRLAAAVAESEIERPGTGLLQLSRFFEAAMTTLLHAGLPGLES